MIQVKKINLSGFVGMIKRADVKDHLENFSLKYDGTFANLLSSFISTHTFVAYQEDDVSSATPYLSSSYFSSISPLTPQDHISPLHRSLKALREWTNKDADYNKYIRPLN